MAGFFSAIFGKPRPDSSAEPHPGIGGFTGASVMPGSTSRNRTNRGLGPRAVKIRADTNTGTQSVTQTRHDMQNNSPAEFFGGPMLKTGEGNHTAGAHPLGPSQRAGGHSMLDTTTPYSQAQFTYEGSPGAVNVRNTRAVRHLAVPGQVHSYKSAPRADQAPVNPGGQATDGNVNPDRVTQDVSVPSRAVFGNLGWHVDREMPYATGGNGARGAHLNGQRYYASGQDEQFLSAGHGSYGAARRSGGKRPVSFTHPAPWSSQYYDTTAEAGTADSPNTSPAQQPSAIYTSPGGGRASNRTQRG